ncbi:DMT family transporter [Acidobacteria bacterium AB60]|nr:DMT family transporter [Acidobacteria bacterium AB60]
MSSSPHLRGILLALAGFTFWVLADTTIKVVGRSPLPAYEVLGFMGLFVSISVAVYCFIRRELRRLKPVAPHHQVVRSLLDLVNNLCVVVALRHVTLPLFYILVFMAPLAVTLLAALFLRELIGTRRLLAVLAGFAGVIIAVNPFSSSRQGDLTGYAACMVCVACFSVNIVWSRVLLRTEAPESLTFFSGIVQVGAGLIGMFFHAAPVDGKLLIGLVGVGIFCAGGALCVFGALRYISASSVTQYHYTQLLTGSLVSWLIWRQPPTLWMAAGGVLIAAAGLYVALPRTHSA